MTSSALSWGVRIRCVHEGCTRVLEQWSTEGTPPLPETGAGVRGGWFFYERSRPEVPYHDLYDVGDFRSRRTWPHTLRVAYCPEHALPAYEWLTAYHRWREDRHAVGRAASSPSSVTVADRLVAFTDPAGVAEDRQKAAKEAVLAWLLEHPGPRPPWAPARRR